MPSSINRGGVNQARAPEQRYQPFASPGQLAEMIKIDFANGPAGPVCWAEPHAVDQDVGLEKSDGSRSSALVREALQERLC